MPKFFLTSLFLALLLIPITSAAQSAQSSQAFFWEIQFRSTTTGTARVTLYDDQGGLLCDNPSADCREGWGTSSPGTPIQDSFFPFTSSSPFNVGTYYVGSTGETIHLQIGNLWAFTSFITARISQEGSTAYYVYSEPNRGYGTGDPASFFKYLPTGQTASATPDYQFTVFSSGGQIQFDSSRPGGQSYDAILGDHFVLPYDRYALLQQGISDSFANLFVARVPQIPTASQRIFVMSSNSQARVEPGWVPNWNLNGLEVLFPPGKNLKVYGSLDVDGALLEQSSVWSGAFPTSSSLLR